MKDSVNDGLFYTGEMHDPETSQYYLRARYYNPLTGLFNRMDPFAGNTQDPQSLHKYLYCHNNPVNGIDPTGMMEWNATHITMAVGIGIALVGLTMMGIGKLTDNAALFDIGTDILILGLAVFAGGGGAAAIGLKTVTESIVCTTITTAIAIMYRLSHHGVIKFGQERLNPGSELHFLVPFLLNKFHFC